LKRAKAVTVAALMVKEPERDDLAIDYERVHVLNVVATALLNPSIRKLGPPEIHIYSVPWGFLQTEENFKTYIDPWLNCSPPYWPSCITRHVKTVRVWQCRNCQYELMRKVLPITETLEFPICPKCKKETVWRYHDSYSIFMEPLWSFFFEMCQYLSLEGYDILRNNFTSWATGQIQLFLSELTCMVDPNLYAEMLGLYSKRRKQDFTEKVKEAAEGVSNANPLG
jgi:ribosomal protein L37AE/L43A